MITEIGNFLWLLTLFGIIWILGAIGHELFHGIACKLQGVNYHIDFWWYDFEISGKEAVRHIKFPSLECYPHGKLTNDDMFYYLGGIGIGSVFAISSLPFYFLYMPLFITLFLVGMSHFFYGLYEGMFIRKLDRNEYMKFHYYVYLGVIILGMILIRNPIINYIW
ncbi:MAG: hypothetical protein IMZ52_00045 [Actinobacteria bacterium]|nr:hypothetical protein [Actinomycetota bacterium]MBE3114801.1 hypothetical protein [Actinomycetota bacterium]